MKKHFYSSSQCDLVINSNKEENSDLIMASGFQVECSPEDELEFKGDFREAIAVKLSIKNLSSDPMFFKLKTTSPQRFVVKPHRGQVSGNETADVTVTLLPFHFKKDKKFNDKFLIQACSLADQNENYSKHDFWSMVPKEQQFQRKLRCTLVHERSSNKEEEGSSSEEDNGDKVSLARVSLNSEAVSIASSQEGRLTPRAAVNKKRNLRKEVEELRITNAALREEVKAQEKRLKELPIVQEKVKNLESSSGDGSGLDAAIVDPTRMIGVVAAALLIGLFMGHFVI